MVLETKSGLEAGVIGGGHGVAAARLDAQRSVAGWVSEQMGGLSYLFYIRDLVRHSTPCNTLQNFITTSLPTPPSHSIELFAVCTLERWSDPCQSNNTPTPLNR